MRSVKDLEVQGKVVLLRTDFNVSFENGEIKDDFRIQASLPTINYLREQGARVLIFAHLGRPKGKTQAELSLRPIAEHLSKLLGDEVLFFTNYAEAKKGVGNLKDGDVALCENIRFDSREESMSEEFARELAALADIYVNDAFGASHRKHTSIYLLPKLMRERAAGLLLLREVDTFQKLRTSAKKPLTFIMGGAKVETKIKLLGELVGQIDAVCLGGLIANSFLAAKGIAIGKSKLENGLEKYVENIELTDTKIHLPIDTIVSTDISGKAPTRITAVADIEPDEMILDIGPDTVRLFSRVMQKAGTIFWNGPMGLFEVKEFAHGTYDLARTLKDIDAEVVVGGGDVMRALREVGAEKYVDYISTGGGAMLEYLAEGTLPGIEALE